MKYIIILLILIPLYSWAQLPPNDSRYEIVFEDEFDDLTINTSRWNSMFPWNQSCLYPDWVCQPIKDQGWGYDKMNFENCEFDTTGTGVLRIVSKERFKYGYFEIMCKLPKPIPPKTNKGAGPAFFMWSAGSEVTWSEIDIFEFNGETNQFGSAVHYEDAYGNILHGIPDHPPPIIVNDGKFHKYAVHWEPNEIKFYFDDQLYLITRLFTDDLLAMPLIIGTAFPLETMCQTVEENTQLPHYFDVEYIRVYQLNYDCNGNYHICNNTGTDLIDYEDVSIGGAGCNPKVTSGNTLKISSNSINIDESFTIEAGGQLNYSYSPCYESFHIIPTSTGSATIPTPVPESYY